MRQFWKVDFLAKAWRLNETLLRIILKRKTMQIKLRNFAVMPLGQVLRPELVRINKNFNKFPHLVIIRVHRQSFISVLIVPFELKNE